VGASRGLIITAWVPVLEPLHKPVPGGHGTLDPEKLTLDVGVLKLNALIAVPLKVIWALLLAVSAPFMVVDWIAPPSNVAALKV